MKNNFKSSKKENKIKTFQDHRDNFENRKNQNSTHRDSDPFDLLKTNFRYIVQRTRVILSAVEPSLSGSI